MKKSLIIILSFLIVQAVVTVVFTTLAKLIFSTPINTDQPNFYEIIGTSLIVSNLIIMAIVTFLVKEDGKNPYKDFFRMSRGKVVALSLFAFIFLTFFITAIAEIFDVPDTLKDTEKGMIENNWCLLAVVFIGPIGEEVCFRRGILSLLYNSPRWRPYALFLSSLIFGVIHLNPIQTFGAFFMGLFLGWIYLRTHSLVLPIFLHVFNNFTSVLISRIMGGEAKLAELFPNTTAYYVATGFSALAAIVLFLVMRKKIPLPDSDFR